MMKYIILLAIAMVAIASAYIRQAREDDTSTDCPNKCKGRPLELSFVVDGSASIWQENFTYALNFIEDFVDGFDISQSAVRVSLVTFGDVVYTQDAFGFSAFSNKEDLKQAISKIPYRSGLKTNTSGGIWYMLHQQIPQARPGIRRVAVVLTDGNSQEAALTKKAADDARRDGLEVFAIGVGQDVSLQELHNIASDDRHVFVVSTYDMLRDIKDRLKYKACADEPEPSCKMDPVDLSFVIDSSASIGEGNFSIGMSFVRDFVDTFQINPSTVRVSAITFGDKLYLDDAFGFDAYTNKKDLLDRLKSIRWQHGSQTVTGAGIHYMRTVQMPRARPSAAHVCIVITDGESQEYEMTKDEARHAQNAGIVMYAVGVGQVGKQLNEEELLNIAGDQRRVLTANSYAQLNLLKDKLAKKTCEGVVEALSIKAARFRV
ncbi:matrilin-1-like [Babylonia areolata]|uniref:matrilin-1-like n=1 Tax=Babylonia areolata TaxID=304850 RepID=UPI003FD2C095